MKKALIVIDYINEIVDEKGKLSKKGYYKFIEENNVIENLNKNIKEFEKNDDLIIFIKLGFSKNYPNHPYNSPLFGKAAEFQILKNDTWSTQIHKSIYQPKNSKTIIKQRISSFYKTGLKDLLKENNIVDVFLCGVATDLAVDSAARDSHDRDFNTFILKDACAASSFEDHQNSLKIMSKIATIV